ncbi:hypothetical protein EK21DRAFT_88938 [Setomelanomma holmii]|uniref:Uncharacterized protein n=1 Tax=Setomelanomma holmii TaxID=210430 RepID=A0A9P4H979_9PLEO|nr:hypothetical protein EK21DRAFT_88938 [Setomelanomma holmii]
MHNQHPYTMTKQTIILTPHHGASGLLLLPTHNVADSPYDSSYQLQLLLQHGHRRDSQPDSSSIHWRSSRLPRCEPSTLSRRSRSSTFEPHILPVRAMSKKVVWIIGGVALVLASLAIATAARVRLGKSQIHWPSTIHGTTPIKTETVFEATEVFSTTPFPLPRRPNATTVTITTTLSLEGAPSVFSSKFIADNNTPTSSINWFPVAPAFSWTPLTATATATATVAPPETDLKCLALGQWDTQVKCEEQCGVADKQPLLSAACQMAGECWKCVT